MGSVSGLVGAFGSVGGAVFGLVFKLLGKSNAYRGFEYMGLVISVLI
jgi:nitrate/nitrite transporter NarK